MNRTVNRTVGRAPTRTARRAAARTLLRLYRARGILSAIAMAILLGIALFGSALRGSPAAGLPVAAIAWAALGLAATCVLLTAFGPRLLPTPTTRIVHAPVAGRWLGLNSPASRVPSHGVRAHGQAHAIDLVHEPETAERPPFGGAMMRASSAYPAFGQPVLAMIDGTVVRASDRRRDHRARSSGLGLCYFLLEGALRELGGPGAVVGNHVVIRGDDGIFAVVAHLRRGSLIVSTGARVVAGQRIAACGNSGNSTEPHVHAQLMDRASFWTAQGLPVAFAGIRTGRASEPVDALPRNGEHLIAAAPIEP